MSSTALNDLTSGQNEWFYQVTSDAELADIYVRWRDQSGELNETEQIRLRLLMFGLLRNAENAFLQISLGAVDATALRGYGLANTPPFQSPAFPPIWSDFKARFHPDFVAAFEAEYDLAP